MQTLELDLKKALSPSIRDYDLARNRLTQMKALGASVARIAYLEALILGHSNPRRKDDALRMIMSSVVDVEIDDIDLLVKACADALFFAETLNEITVINRLWYRFNRLIVTHHDHESVLRWRGTIELHVGCFYVITKKYSEGISMLKQMLIHGVNDPSFFCQITKAHAYLAIAYAKSGNIAKAIDHVFIAGRDATDRYMPMVNRAKGEVLLCEGKIDDAEGHFDLSATVAERYDDYVTMTWATLGLCAVYARLAGTNQAYMKAYAQAARLVRTNAMNHDLPCVIEALADIDVVRL
jgi:tetratricopeptide (TPR) repeat protein